MSRLFEQMSAADESDSAAERKADRPLSGELNLEGKAITHSSSSGNLGGSINRGVSVFHNRGGAAGAVPISNSDRTTVSQIKALSHLKNRRASTGSAPAPAVPRRNHFRNDEPE